MKDLLFVSLVFVLLMFLPRLDSLEPYTVYDLQFSKKNMDKQA